MIRTLENGKKVFSIEMDRLDDDFVEQVDYLEKKYGETFEYMNGFHNENLNCGGFIDAFIDAAVPADVSPDGNANSGTHDVCTLINDMMKPHGKLLSYNKIYYDMKKEYGKIAADTWLEWEWSGAFYMHNGATSSFKPYCYAYDLDQLVEKGLFFTGKFRTEPAKHLTTFTDHVLEFVSWTSNRCSGAKLDQWLLSTET